MNDGILATGTAAFLRNFYRDKTTNISWSTASTSSAGDGAISCLPGFQIFVQKITALIEASDAETMTFQSEDGTVKVGAIASAPVTNSFLTVADWGEEGKPLPVGDDLDILVSDAGLGVDIHIEAFMRQVSARKPSEL
jgi:hypothetical protein